MTAQKSEPPAPQRAGLTEKSSDKGERKPWKKRTPAEVILDQINRVKEDVAKREEELKLARRQLQKLEEVKRVLESTT
jgi:hypothetical protein